MLHHSHYSVTTKCYKETGTFSNWKEYPINIEARLLNGNNVAFVILACCDVCSLVLLNVRLNDWSFTAFGPFYCNTQSKRPMGPMRRSSQLVVITYITKPGGQNIEKPNNKKETQIETPRISVLC